MRRLIEKLPINRKVQKISLWLAALVFILIITGCGNDYSGDFHEGIISPRFSIDNQKIIFGYCSGTKKDTKCDLATYEIATQKIYRFNPTK